LVSFIWKGTILCPLPNRGTLEFSACQDLKNPWNDNKPVKISRDGQVSKLGSWAINVYRCSDCTAMTEILDYIRMTLSLRKINCVP